MQNRSKIFRLRRKMHHFLRSNLLFFEILNHIFVQNSYYLKFSDNSWKNTS